MPIESFSVFSISILLSTFWIGLFMIVTYSYSFHFYLQKKMKHLSLLILACILGGSLMANQFQKVFSLESTKVIFTVNVKSQNGNWTKEFFLLPQEATLKVTRKGSEISSLTYECKAGFFTTKGVLKNSVSNFKMVSKKPLELVLKDMDSKISK